MKELEWVKARMRCPESILTHESTAELEPLDEIIGQDRAIKALRFGLKIKRKGFNIYVAGEPGTGKETAIKNFLDEVAKTQPVPSDWCYVNNFRDPSRPSALRLPGEKGSEFKKDMEKFVSDMKKALSNAFESDEYAKKRENTLRTTEEDGVKLTNQINSLAEKAGFKIERSPIGLMLIPIIKGRPINEEEFAQLPPNVQEDLQEKQITLQSQLQGYMRQFRDLGRKAEDAVEELNHSIALFALEPSISTIKEKYRNIDEVIDYINEVQEDILDNLSNILEPNEEKDPKTPLPFTRQRTDPTERYRVNLVVDNSELKGAPVIIELNPTYSRLFGGSEKEASFGALTTDYTMIRSGSAHRANGGFLVVPVEGLFLYPMVWNSLKRAILNEMLEIEEPTEGLGVMMTRGLRPEPIPFDAKVIVIGGHQIYNLLYSRDKDFKELFKVKADFDTVMDRNDENVKRYASFIGTLCSKEDLTHLDPSGAAAVIEYSSRLAQDQNKLSTRFADVADIIREACFYAEEGSDKQITRNHVERALEEKVYRSNLIQRKLQEMIERGIILIDTEGEKVGQVNGLSVLSLGDYEFGSPSRVTASVSIGREGIIDIEREARLGGPIHTKGVLILSGYLGERYAQEKPLSLAARLVFEQSYSGVEGDSASSTELYAILSALSGKPIKQNLAVTGSVNQKGEVQAIGGVNEKIEGFFEVCKAKGLNGKQGVVIPASNVTNLMLKEEVVEAIKNGSFHIHPVRTINEGIEILTGVKAGERLPDGSYEEDTVNNLVQRRLMEMADKLKDYYPSTTR